MEMVSVSKSTSTAPTVGGVAMVVLVDGACCDSDVIAVRLS